MSRGSVSYSDIAKKARAKWSPQAHDIAARLGEQLETEIARVNSMNVPDEASEESIDPLVMTRIIPFAPGVIQSANPYRIKE